MNRVIAEEGRGGELILHIDPELDSGAVQEFADEAASGAGIVEVRPMDLPIDVLSNAWYAIEKALHSEDVRATGGVAPAGVLVVTDEMERAKGILRDRGIASGIPILWEDLTDDTP